MEQDRTHFSRRLESLKSEVNVWTPHWRELSKYVSPRASRFLANDRQNQGTVKSNDILDNTATISVRTLASGMLSGITNPARPWIQLRVPDPDLNKFQPVKVHLDTVRKVLMEVFQHSNLYSMLPQTYGDLGLFGTHALFEVEDRERLVHFGAFPIGSYSLGTDHLGRVDACYREFQMTVSQLVRKFGEENCSSTVLNHWKGGRYNEWMDVCYAVEPNHNWDSDKLGGKWKRFVQVYWESASKDKPFLDESGFDEFPVMAPRWMTVGEDVYGSSPGMDALGDIKMLQQMNKKSLQALEKKVSPAVNIPVELKEKLVNLLPNGANYVDMTNSRQGITPAYQVQMQLSELDNRILQTQERIKEAFFTNLFLMMANDLRSNVTATEIAARQEEKLLALGPVYLKINDELLDPLVYRTLGILERAGVLPPPPPEMDGMPLSIEYVSVLHQAMKAVGVAAIERTSAYVGNLIPMFPEVADRFNADAAVDEYAEMAGTSPKVLRDDKEVKVIRQQRANDAKAAQAMAMAQQGADTAATLANAPSGGDTVLAQLVQNMQGAPPPYPMGAPA